MTLLHRLAQPYGDTPLFPNDIKDMTNADQWEELRDCSRALTINVWQTTEQMEQVETRKKALIDSISAYLETGFMA